ncbi:MAG: DUF393 domain-containing protein [Armatimonadetes bacterium]|nr:DUF393 domain-containing protein [Armatimonadota bacterium]
MAWKLFYDASCQLCHESQLRVEGWAKAAGQPLEVHALHSPEGQLLGLTTKDIVLIVDRTYVGSDAWIKLCEIAPWPLRWVSVAGKVPVARWAVAVVYRFVAATRHRWRGQRECPVPSNESSAKG